MSSNYIPNIVETLKKLKNNISLESLAIGLGYTKNIKKSTTNYAFYEYHHDQILIYFNNGDPSQHYYTTCNNNTDKGDLISLLINKGICKNNIEAVNYLKDFSPSVITSIPNKVSQKQNHVEPTQFTPLNTFPLTQENYLIKERGIELKYLESDVFIGRVKGLLKNDGHSKPAIFPMYSIDDKVIGQFIRSENKKRALKGSNKSNGFWSSNIIDHRSMIVFENPLDAISYYQLNMMQDSKKSLDMNYYATFGSTSAFVVEHICKKALANSMHSLILSGDNNAGGQRFNLLFIITYISLRFADKAKLKLGYNIKTNTAHVTVNLSSYKLALAFHTKLTEVINSSNWNTKPQLQIHKDQQQVIIEMSHNSKDFSQLSNSMIKLFNINQLYLQIPISDDYNDDLINYQLHSSTQGI